MAKLETTIEIQDGECGRCGHEGTVYGPVGGPALCMRCMDRAIDVSIKKKSTTARASKEEPRMAKRNPTGPPQPIVNFREDLAGVRSAAAGLRDEVESYGGRATSSPEFAAALESALKHAKKAVEELDKLGLSLLAAAGAAAEAATKGIALEEQGQLEANGKDNDG